MRRLLFALLLCCTPAYAEQPKPAPKPDIGKPTAKRGVPREQALELRALDAELQAIDLQLQVLRRQGQEKLARRAAILKPLNLGPDEAVSYETGEVVKRR